MPVVSWMNHDAKDLRMRPFDTIVISDLHLGARNARHGELLAFLDQVETDHLILNGDVFEDARLRGLGAADIDAVDALRQYALHTDLTWLVGNHDPHPSWFVGLLGIQPADEIVLEVGGWKYLVCHGHKWDRSMHWPSVIIGTADAVYRGCQALDKSHRLARFLKHKSKWFVRAVGSLQRKSLETARRRGYHGVIVGHTHVLGDVDVQGVHYLNSGCWTETPTGFVGIRDGEAQAYRYCDGKISPLCERPVRPLGERRLHESLVENEVEYVVERELESV